MNAFFEFFKFFVWLLLRQFYLTWRWILWKLSGVSRHLNYILKFKVKQKSVHVRSIIYRFAHDPINLPCTEQNFITIHEKFEDPEYVLKDCVTLYGINEHEATFVETDPDDDVLHPDNGGFLKVSQFRLAKKFIVMPMHSFHLLADTLPDVSDKLVFLSNTMRCGSTLLTQFFQETGECLSFGEPDCVNSLTHFLSKYSQEKHARIIKNTFKVFCKPLEGKSVKKYCIKIAGPSMWLLPTLYEIYPQSKYLFMYRELLPNIKSISKLLVKIPFPSISTFLGHYSPSLAKAVFRLSCFPRDTFKDIGLIKSSTHLSCLFWVGIIKQYLVFREGGLPIKAVKYDDLMKSTRKVCEQMCNCIGLEFNTNIEEAITIAFSKDSQRNSPLSMEAMKNVKEGVFDTETLSLIDTICKQMEVPSLDDQPISLPGTLT